MLTLEGGRMLKTFAFVGLSLAWACAKPAAEEEIHQTLERDAGSTLDASLFNGKPDCTTPLLDSGTADAGLTLSFDCDIYPLLVRDCGECHAEGGFIHEIAHSDRTIAYADSLAFADRIVARIKQQTMPPTCLGDPTACVPQEDLAKIEQWLEQGTPR